MLNRYTSFVVVAMVLALVVSVLLTVGYLFFIDKKKTAEITKTIKAAELNIINRLGEVLPKEQIDAVTYIVTEEMEKIFEENK
jgi:uncharacterized membrane protein (DUF106 family)